MQVSDDLRLGPVYLPNPDNPGPSLQELGVGPLGRVYIFDVVPLVSVANGLAVAQAVGAAGNLTLTAGAGVTTSVNLQGQTLYTLDTPRNIIIDSSGAGDTTQTALVSGYDQYGQPMSELIAFNGTTAVQGNKAFKSVTTIAISAAMAGNAFIGFGDKLGLPYRVANVAYVLSVKWNSTLADDAGTFVAAVATSPATTTTGDVRGTYVPSSATDGTKRLVMALALPALAVGPNATRIGAAGVTQA